MTSPIARMCTVKLCQQGPFFHDLHDPHEIFTIFCQKPSIARHLWNVQRPVWTWLEVTGEPRRSVVSCWSFRSDWMILGCYDHWHVKKNRNICDMYGTSMIIERNDLEVFSIFRYPYIPAMLVFLTPSRIISCKSSIRVPLKVYESFPHRFSPVSPLFTSSP